MKNLKFLKYYIALCFLLANIYAFAQPKYTILDSLNTKAEIQTFAKKAFKHKIEDLSIMDSFTMDVLLYSTFMNKDSTYNKKPIYKIDIDNNNTIDLILIYSWDRLYYIGYDSITKKSTLVKFYKNWRDDDRIFFKLDSVNNEVLYYGQKARFGEKGEAIIIIYKGSLILYRGYLIESYPSIKTKEKISQVELIKSTCIGSKPIRKIILNNKSFTETRFKPFYKENLKPIYKTKKQFELVERLINKIDIVNKSSRYGIPSDECMKTTLVIKYKNGTAKTINDFQSQEDFDLNALYDFIESMTKE